MALITCDFFSETLEVGTSLTVVLPQQTAEQIGVASTQIGTEGPPVLYLLHGLSDDHTAWLRYTSIERYATARGLAVVMPAVGRSFYANEAHGHPYWDYVSKELHEVVASFFKVSTRREDTFVAGLSMGGYGALKLGLHHPERYAAVASLSGAVDVRSLAGRLERVEIVERVFDSTFGPGDDLYELVAAVDPSTMPPALRLLRHRGGPADGRQQAASSSWPRSAGLDVTTDFRPGIHEWGLWDEVIQDVIAWLPLASVTP